MEAPIASILPIAAGLRADPCREVPRYSLPKVRSLGDLSYGVYLIHLPLILFVAALARRTGFLDSRVWIAAIAVTLSIGYGYLSARVIELPIRRWAHRYGRRSENDSGPLPPVPIRG